MWLPRKPPRAAKKDAAKAATCTANGSNEYYTCSVCGKVFKADKVTGTTAAAETVKATGHTPGVAKQENVKAATADKQGSYDLTVRCTKCNAVISSEHKTTPKTVPDYLLADVDGDGKISASDARLALRRSVGLEKFAEGSREFLAADADKDKKVTAADARLILRASVGLEDPKKW